MIRINPGKTTIDAFKNFEKDGICSLLTRRGEHYRMQSRLNLLALWGCCADES